LVPIVFPGQKATDAIETGSRVRPNQTEFMSDRILSAVMAWPEAPSYADVAAAYPAEARIKGVGGRATLDCIFTSAGRLTACTTAQEDPRGEGFSVAATSLAKLFRAESKTPDGDPVVRAHVQLPIAFTPDMLAGEPPVLSRPGFAVTPAPEDVADAYPQAARAAGVATGRGVLACKVQQAGALSCQVQGEEPAGYGFGEAALKVAPLFRVQTWGADGLPAVGRTVKLAMRFDRPDDGAAAGR
jgi:TonB family protein